jgi:two-component system chemotaxis response regulator CheB
MPNRDIVLAHDIVAIGTSAGGVQSLSALVRKLPADFDATILAVIHLPAGFHSTFDRILSREGPLPATFAIDGEKISHRHIYIAPPDRHLLLDGDRLVLGHGPRENNSRPAIDPLFRSVGLCCPSRAIGVVLSGMLGDGAAGLLALKQRGGITIVQDPQDALFEEMPATALRQVEPDYVIRLAALPTLLKKVIKEPAASVGRGGDTREPPLRGRDRQKRTDGYEDDG